MKTCRLFPVALLPGLLALLLGLPPARAATITVTSAANTGAGTLRNAITAAAAGDTINFAAALNGQTIVLTSGELVINKNLSILGPGATNLAISGNAGSRVFSINPGVICTLAGLTLTNGNGVGAESSGYGGGIFSRGILTVSNTTLIGNSAALSGGGICVPLGTATIRNSNLSGNWATNEGGGIFNSFTTVTVQNSTLSGNAARFQGGGIYNDYGTLTVQNCTLSGNSAEVSGGIHNGNDSTTTVQNSTLTGNSASSYGGIGNDFDVELTLQNSTLTGNSAEFGTGGLDLYGTVRLTNCIVAGNFRAGGVVPSDLADGLQEEDSAAYNLIGTDFGSGGITHGVNGNIVGNSFEGTIPITSILDTNLAFNGGPTRTHALVRGSPALYAGTNVASLPATDQRGAGFPRIVGGRVDIGAYEAPLMTALFTFCPGTIVTNVANGTDTRAVTFPTATGNPAPMIACVPPSGSLFSVGSTLVTCTATNLAGTNICTFTVTVCATNIVVANVNNSGPGSLRTAISNACPFGTITFAPALNGQTIVLTSGELVINKSLGILGPGATNLAISGNGSSRVFSINSGVTTLIAGLTITNGNGLGALDSGSGGGIHNRGTLTVSNSTLSGNSAIGYGGGIRSVDGKVVFRYSTLSSNSAMYGGGIQNGGASTLLFQNSSLSGNSAAAGGGIHNSSGGAATVQNSTLSGNSAGVRGGGIFNTGSGTVTVQNSTLSGNRGVDGGGGIFANAAVRLTNCIVAGNFIGTTPNDIEGTAASADYNLIGSTNGVVGITHGVNGNIVGNAGAGTLAITSILDTNLVFNGGPTRTHALVPGSPAINAGTNIVVSLPNAWQIADVSAVSGSGSLAFTNVLTPAQRVAATNSGWHYTVVSRLVAGSTNNSPAHFMVYGNGARRFYVAFDTNAAGQLVAIRGGTPSITNILTAAGAAATAYHTHELIYDPATTQATYLFDGSAIGTWAGLNEAFQNGTAQWGTASSGGQGTMNYHRVQFAIEGLGTVSEYVAGFAASPAVAPSPTNQGWNLVLSAVGNAVTNAPISPDTDALPPSLSLDYDQRGPGFPRIVTGRVDIGAYEFQAVAPTITCPGNLITNVVNGTDTRAVSWTVATNGNPAPVVTCVPPSGSLFGVGASTVTCTATNSAGTDTCTFNVTVCATNIVVTGPNDSGAGTLRTAISNACPGGTITFAPALNGQTLVLTSGELGIAKNLSILGSGATNLAISGNGLSRVFFITNGVTCTLAGLTVTNGNGVGVVDSGQGGAIYNSGTLTVSNCTFRGNFTSGGGHGGGIYNFGTLTAQNSTLGGNVATNGAGGGVFNNLNAFMTVDQCTLSGNSAGTGGGIANSSGGTLTLRNSTLSGNRGIPGGLYAAGNEVLVNCLVAGNSIDGTAPSDIGGGAVQIANYNLIGDAGSAGGLTHGIQGNIVGMSGGGTIPITSILDTNLAFNGGPTRTHALVPGSPAINVGANVSDLPDFDQRGPGFPRVAGGSVDIGAYELQATAPAITCPGNISTTNTPGQCYATNVAFTVPGASGIPAPVVICRLTNTVVTSPRSFNVGTNVVTCTATNVVGTNVCSFTVIVRDAEAPVVVCPADFALAVPPLSNSVAAVFAPSATDNCGTNGVVIACAPPSGSYFPIGTNTVNCTATDAAGNLSAPCSFKVIVALPEFSLVGSGLTPVSFGTVAWGDYDNDGRLDLVLSGGASGGRFTQIWRNQGNNTFSNINAGLPGLDVSTAAWGDYNNDGRLDLAIAGNTGAGRVAQIWRNTGSGFVNANAGLTGVDDASLAWGDYDRDGRPDLLLTGYDGGSRVAQVWRNMGGSFSNINAGLTGLSTGGAAWGDYDRDGRLDIVLTGLDSGSARRTELWRNTGTGFALQVTPFPGVSASAVAWGDFDNDGWPDLALAGFTGSGAIAQVWRNTGGSFSNVNAGLPGVSECSVAWGDYDNDGKPDLLLTGTAGGGPLSQIWRSTGTNFVLTPSGLAPVRIGRAAWGDYDNDGRLDVALMGLGSGSVRAAEVWHNNFTGATNTVPAAPAGLVATPVGGGVQLRWNAATDGQTPAAGLGYNLSVGTNAGGVSVLAPHSDLAAGRRRLPGAGNVPGGTNATLELPPGTYYWSVQSVDSAWAGGPFASGGSFVVSTTVRIVAWEKRGPSQFWIEFTGVAGAAYRVESSQDLQTWTDRGLATPTTPGRYEFTDNAAPATHRFYRATLP